MSTSSSQLEKFILDSNLVSKADFAEALTEAQKRKVKVEEILVNSEKITEDNLRRMQAHVEGIPFVDLRGAKIPLSVLSIIPEPISRNHNIVALKKTEDSLEVALLDIQDLSALDFIKNKLQVKILARLTDTESMKNCLVEYQKGLRSEFGNMIQREAKATNPITTLDMLLRHAMVQNTSDVHLESLEDGFLVRYRINGIIHDSMILPKSIELPMSSRIKSLSSQGKFTVTINEEKISFRVYIIPTSYGEKIVLRIFKSNTSGFTLETLGFHGEALERVYYSLREKKGFILVTGPAGSWKTTTLYTLLDLLNSPDTDIRTIESPIEHRMKRVSQTEVSTLSGITYPSGLRTILRQDPDVIMIGGMRDGETVSLAVNAASMGIMVLSSFFTNRSSEVIPAMLAMKIEPIVLASTMNTIIAERLVRRLSEKKEKYLLSPTDIVTLGKAVDISRVLTALKQEKVVKESDTWETVHFWKAKSSADEKESYNGHLAIHEVLKVTESIKELIMRRAVVNEIEIQAKKEGMLTMLEDGIFKAVQGHTTIEEVFRVLSKK